MLLLQGESKAIDDAAEDLQQLGNAIMVLSLEDEAVEDVVDGLPDERPMDHEFAVDAMKDGLEVIPFPRVF